ncbi:hypothetical protein ACIRPX_42770 [Streptomyces sp. NPDC101225]|uniref:effector-associated constant component EACC1 n=1 Tax=Streptomyces sp. NPDC101225 TaxID=3366135 RepID=UPI0038053A35
MLWNQWMHGRTGAATVDVVVGLTPDGVADAEVSERLARRLRAEMRGLDLDSLRMLAEGAVPERAKAGTGDAVTMGAVVLAASASGGVLPSLVGLLQDWLGRQSARYRISVTIDGDTLELERATAEERQQLITAFVRRHGAGAQE